MTDAVTDKNDIIWMRGMRRLIELGSPGTACSLAYAKVDELMNDFRTRKPLRTEKDISIITAASIVMIEGVSKIPVEKFRTEDAPATFLKHLSILLEE